MPVNQIKPKVKVCCIQSIGEVKLAISAGASAIGLVSEMPSGPGVIPEADIARIARTVPRHIDTFLLTSLQNANEIIVQYDRCRTTAIQFVDWITPETYKILRSELTDVKFVQVIHVTDKKSVADAKFIEPYVDFLLLDSGNVNIKPKILK